MGKRKYGQYIGKSIIPRQTRWNRKRKKQSEGNAGANSSESESSGNEYGEAPFDQLSLTGNFMTDRDWDISSVSSFNDEEHLHLSDTEDAEESGSSEDAEDDNLAYGENCIPLFSGSQISRSESLHLVLAFSRKENITREATEDLLKLIRLHLPKGTFYPTSDHKFKKQINVPMVPSKFYMYCGLCKAVLDNGVCPDCEVQFSEKQLLNAGEYFIVFDIRSQLETMLSNKIIKEHVTTKIMQRNSNNAEENEATYWNHYSDVVQNWDLSGIINTDGVPVFHSSKYSIWPVLLALNELPYNVRKSAVLLGALWSGSTKINVSMVFSKFIPVLNELQDKGIIWTNSFGQIIHSKLFFQKASVDAVARCLVQGISQFNGAYGCNYCKEKGTVIAKGRGRSRIYNISKNLNLRTDADFRKSILEGNFQFGIKSASPFLQLKHFDMIEGFVVEPMHNLFLGVSKMIFNIWFTLRNSDCYLGEPLKKQQINTRLLSCKVPTEIVRTVRSLETFKHWKASEFRSMVFILSVVTSDMLPKSYSTHFSKLANSVYYLSLPRLQANKLAVCKKSLQQFVRRIPNLYGEEYMTYNVHLLLHLVQSCHEYGPLWQFSALMFESFNAVLLKYVSNAKGVAIQILKKFNYGMQTRFSAQALFKNEAAGEMFSYLARVPRNRPQMHVIRKPLKLFEGDASIRDQCSAFANWSCIFTAKTALIGGTLFKTKETEKRADCYVKVNKNHIGKIREFLQIDCLCDAACTCQNELAVMDVFRVTCVPRLDFAFQCPVTVRKKIKVTSIHQLTNDKVFKLEYNDTMYFLHVCNLFEID